jgi:hypothetical protein
VPFEQLHDFQFWLMPADKFCGQTTRVAVDAGAIGFELAKKRRAGNCASAFFLRIGGGQAAIIMQGASLARGENYP